jgi:D-alanyl-lipoteichoic acid acyltransferase DltB (MBOAT superfamily)
MLFSSYAFVFIFLPAVALGFAAARRHSVRAGIMVLAASSLIFYAAWKPIFLILLIGSIAANFAIGLAMERTGRRQLLGLSGVALNLIVLAYFKYAEFIVDILNSATGAHLTIGAIVLPIGISFFTFQQIAYLVDVMRGTPAERDIVSYTLFVSFFPHLIAGPLVHHAEMIPQFKDQRDRRYPLLASRGLAMFIAGLFKKVVLADSLAQFATPAFRHVDAGGQIDMLWAWIATLAYTLQIYFDFSGYSDMALGLALMFGIRLPVNFRSPYQSLSIIEFWRRWHITLSRFLRDYLYIPLGGNRRGKPRRYVNLMITMLLGGLWHGAGWNFVIWGGLHGAYLVLNNFGRARRRSNGKSNLAPHGIGRIVAWIITFGAVVIAWVFFRAETLGGALTMLHAMAGFADASAGVTYIPPATVRFAEIKLALGAPAQAGVGLAMIAVGLLIVLALPNVPQIFGYHEVRRAPEATARLWLRWRPDAIWAVIIAAAFTVCLFGMWQRLEFLYFQF